MTVPGRPLGPLRDVLRAIATLDDADLERLVRWFGQYVNLWGQTPHAVGRHVDPGARHDVPRAK
jgi:hypothetical protein